MFFCIEIQFDYKSILPKLLMAKVILFPYKGSSQNDEHNNHIWNYIENLYFHFVRRPFLFC